MYYLTWRGTLCNLDPHYLIRPLEGTMTIFATLKCCAYMRSSVRNTKKTTGSHQTENLLHFKGNVEKKLRWFKKKKKPSYIKHSIRVLLTERQKNIFNTDPKQSQGETHEQKCCVRQRLCSHPHFPLVSALLLLPLSGWNGSCISRCTWRVVCLPSDHPAGDCRNF